MNKTDTDFFNGINELLGYSLPGNLQSLNINMSVNSNVSITVTYYPFREEAPYSVETVTKTFGLVEIINE